MIPSRPATRRRIGLLRGVSTRLLASLLCLCAGCEDDFGEVSITSKGCRFWGRGAIADTRMEMTEHGHRCVLEIDRRRITETAPRTPTTTRIES